MDVIDQWIHPRCALYCGDSLELSKALPDKSVDFTIFSPPFSDLFCYSSSERDLGNLTYDKFVDRFGELAVHMARLTKPGRLVAVHCIDIPAMKERDGYIGLKDFPGDIIRACEAAGFVYHSRVTIWKDPLIEATRTKALGLMHKQLCKDSTICRMGLPDYLVVFRSPGDNQNPVAHPEGLSKYVGSARIPSGNQSHNIWRAYASPVWDDIRQTRVLKHKDAREQADEKHICPLQTDTVERAIMLWSNPDDVVFTPCAGVGTEVYCAVLHSRRAIGMELAPKYFKQAVNHVSAILNGEHKDEGELELATT